MGRYHYLPVSSPMGRSVPRRSTTSNKLHRAWHSNRRLLLLVCHRLSTYIRKVRERRTGNLINSIRNMTSLNIHLSPDEKEYILKNANLIPTRKIAEYIGCSQCAIQYLLRKHGIARSGLKVWTKQQTETLISLCTGDHTIQDIAYLVGMTQRQVRGHIDALKRKGMKLYFKRKQKR